jgi:hypothetical protein
VERNDVEKMVGRRDGKMGEKVSLFLKIPCLRFCFGFILFSPLKYKQNLCRGR